MSPTEITSACKAGFYVTDALLGLGGETGQSLTLERLARESAALQRALDDMPAACRAEVRAIVEEGMRADVGAWATEALARFNAWLDDLEG